MENAQQFLKYSRSYALYNLAKYVFNVASFFFKL